MPGDGDFVGLGVMDNLNDHVLFLVTPTISKAILFLFLVLVLVPFTPPS